MFEAPNHPTLVPFDGSFRLSGRSTRPPPGAETGRKACEAALDRLKDQLDERQRILQAHDHHAVLLVFQALDAAGKDSTIRAVLRGLDPAGFQVFSFKQPSREELDHDFLWRTSRALPERGRIGVFNRSYYEEVLVVRVHPELLAYQNLPEPAAEPTFWEERLASIRDHELHLARNGVVILKFFLHVSKDEQRKRFLSRLDEPEKNWKFSLGDVEERRHFERYMAAYNEALNSTSKAWAPWYAVPADDKDYMRVQVATILRDALDRLQLAWPTLRAEDAARIAEMRQRLLDEKGAGA